jgi:hypothetical protein
MGSSLSETNSYDYVKPFQILLFKELTEEEKCTALQIPCKN